MLILIVGGTLILSNVQYVIILAIVVIVFYIRERYLFYEYFKKCKELTEEYAHQIIMKYDAGEDCSQFKEK